MESFSFFTAIHERKYFSHISKEDAAEQAVKKLRYYARYIIVCLLLKRMKTARELIDVVQNVIFVDISELGIQCTYYGPLEQFRCFSTSRMV